MKTATNWALAFLLAVAVGSAHHLDGADDHSADWAQSANLLELQAAEQASARQLQAAQNLCHEARGPNSEARFTPEGHLVCSTRRGPRPLATAHASEP